jgi:hypothetical protein
MSVTLPTNRGISYLDRPYLEETKGSLDAQGNVATGQTNRLFDATSGGYSAMAQGGTEAEKGAFLRAGENSARSGYGALRDQMARRSARTGNTAGYYGGLATAGEGEADAMAANSRAGILNSQQLKEKGLAGLSGLESQTGNMAGGYAALRAQLASLKNKEPGATGSSSYNYGGNYGGGG